MLYSIARFFIENIRADSLMIHNFRVSQILSLIIFLTSIITIFVKKYAMKKGMSKKVESRTH